MPKPNAALVEARLQRGISQKVVAQAIGVSLSTVARWEKGVTEPFAYHRRKLVDFFGKPPQELGLAPSQRVWHSHETAFPLSTSLPPFEGPLVGREHDLTIVRQQLRVPAPVVLIAGLPGVGKTALALALASDPEVRSLFEAGVLWVSVGRNASLSKILTTWGTNLGLSGKPLARVSGEKGSGVLRDAFGEWAVLLVLDDVWTEADAQALVACAGPRCGVLITTRFPRRFSRLNAQIHLVRELEEEPSLALLTHLAPQAVALEPRRTRELVRALGGLPLALMATGRFLGQQTSAAPHQLQEALTRLSDAEERLRLPLAPEGMSDEPTLASTIGTSVSLLDEATHLALSRLALFPPRPLSFSAEAALAMAGCDLLTLDTLQDIGVLERGEEGRLQIHHIIADYGRASLPPPERQLAYERFLAFVQQALDAHHTDRAWLTTESQVLLFALGVARDRETPHAFFSLVLAFAPWMLEEWVLIALDHVQAACDRARRLHEYEVLPRLLLPLGHAFVKTAQYPEAMIAYQEGIHLARHMKDTEQECKLLAAAVWACFLHGEDAQAQRNLAQAWELAKVSRRSDETVAVLWALQGVGNWRCGDYVQAEAACSRSIHLFQQLPEKTREYLCLPLCFLAMIGGARGHYDQAEALFQQALSAAQRSGPSDFQLFILGQRGLMGASASTSLSHLRKELGAALLLARDRCAIGYAQTIFRAVALVELAHSNGSTAEHTAQQALRLNRQSGAENQQGEILTLLARIALAPRASAQADRYLAEAWPLVQRFCTVEDQALLQEVRGELALARGEHAAALEAFREMARLVPSEHRVLRALASYHLARCMAASGHKRAARREGEKSLREMETLGHVCAQEVRAWLATLRPVWRWPARGLFSHTQQENQQANGA